jgi:hypothetical protein
MDVGCLINLHIFNVKFSCVFLILIIISRPFLSLQLAALNGHEELVKLLLENGANPFVKNQVYLYLYI